MSPLTEPTKLILKKESVAATDVNIREVSLLLHGNADGSGNILDSSLSPKTISKFGNVAASTPPSYPNSNSTFGNAIAFDGNGDYLSISSSNDLILGASDFTIETWARLASTGAQHDQIVTTGESEIATGFSFQRLNSGELNFRSAANTYSFNSSTNVPINTWAHLVACRSGTTLRLFIDGSIVFTGTFNGNLTDPAVLVGYRNPAYNGYLNGYIDELRITKGVARYTSNFTPPTAPFPDF